MSWGPIICRTLVCGVAFLVIGASAHAQDFDIAEEVWKPIMEDEGLAFSYIFYREADTKHNGVVIRLINTNEYDLAYEFTVVFRAGEAEQEQFVKGTIEAGTMKTGEGDGLFWIPFLDERQIREVGLRDWQMRKINGTS